jgi:hypothetical protein
MRKTPANLIKLAAAVLAGILSTAVLAQSSSLRSEHPELANLYNAFDVTQAELFDAITRINVDPATREARNELRMELETMANMDTHDMAMPMTGPYGEAEIQARVQLYGLLQSEHSDGAAAEAFANSDALTVHAGRVMSHGRSFENAVWDIFAETSTTMYQKRAAVDAAIEKYRADDPRHAISLTPKSADLYLAHPYANGLKSGFPRLSGLMWTNQWLQLASLEAIIVGQVDPQFAGSVPTTLERYTNKLGSDTGMTIFPPPSEMPSAPAIAPQLYTQSPQAAVIIDNLNMLEVALADVIAYPNLDDRDAIIDAVVGQYTSDAMYLTDTWNYLLNALRGGIFNQGGPAIGELDQSERNRPRSAMDMQHNSIIMQGEN